jgi:hypothetical protein
MSVIDSIAVHDVYRGPREVWDERKCAKLAKQRLSNSYGDKWPYPGLVSALQRLYRSGWKTVQGNGPALAEASRGVLFRSYPDLGYAYL